jgi:CitMHS family citrate-Mg2+:H+ or citrate-Ca2+:H+ symporter
MASQTTLALVSFLMIVIIVWSLIQSKTNPVPIFVVVPILAAIMCGFAPTTIFEFIKKGVGTTWSTAVLFIFSIIYFSIMGDVGLFDPLVNWLVKHAGSNILLVTVATACIAVITHLDGALASTLLITIPAMLPVYKKLHMRPVVICAIVGAAMSIMNLCPWGGPVARCGVILKMDVNTIWKELIPTQGVGIVILILFAIYLGLIEKRRGAGLIPTGKAAELTENIGDVENSGATEAEVAAMKRPKLLWFNSLLTLGVILSLCLTKIPMYAAFMIGLAIALLVNFPGAKAQASAIKMHAATALTMPMVLLASGVFLGVLTGSKMIEAMAKTMITLIPDFVGPHLQLVFGLLAVPIGALIGTDSYFFGLMPLAIGVGKEFGATAHDMMMAMLIGKNYGVLVTPHAATTFLCCGLAGIEIKELFKFCAPYLWVLSWISLTCAMFLGVFQP